jgi:glycosyltransferase involved in cell wall biosynthesis
MGIFIIAVNNIGVGLSGGDSIWINLAKHWDNVTILGSKSTLKTLAKQDDFNLRFLFWCPGHFEVKNPFSKWGIFWNTVYKTYWVILGVFQVRKKFNDGDIILSASDFLPDVIPALILKIRNPRIRWVAAFYLFAPCPLLAQQVYATDRVRGLFYWLMQRLTYPLIKHFADVVLVTGDSDRGRFPRTVVVRGGVDKLGTANKNPKYDVLFIGRFHRQKGILELLDMWGYVREALPSARMCMVGDGELYKEAKKRKNGSIDMPGFVYGEALNKIIMDSKVIVHPATYDSGGMAMVHGMAYGLPGVCFDLPQLKTYYNNGIIKAEHSGQFIKAIVDLLTNAKLYDSMSHAAKEDVKKRWLWENQQKRIWEEIEGHILYG